MVYIIYGIEEYLIQKEINKIIETNKIDPFAISKYSEEDMYIENILEDANTISMFGSKKMVLLENISFLTGSSKKTITDEDIKNLENYIKNPNPDTIFLFTVYHEKLDERKKIVKMLKKYAHIKECKQENNIKQIKQLFEGYQIEENLLSLFIERVGDNLRSQKEEAEKLKLYRLEEKKIEKKDIIELINKTVDLNIFTFIENIIKKEKKEAIETYKEMMKRNEEPIAIVIMLASQFRIMYQGKELLKKGYSEKMIADTLNIHPFRVKKALEKAKYYTSDILLHFLKKLIQLDLNIKSGKVNKELALELFILGI